MASDPAYEYRTRHAGPFSEPRVLREMGEAGWELVGIWFSRLEFRRPRDGSVGPWEYRRRWAWSRSKVLDEMTGEGWEPCGTWASYHYFKRRPPSGAPDIAPR